MEFFRKEISTRKCIPHLEAAIAVFKQENSSMIRTNKAHGQSTKAIEKIARLEGEQATRECIGPIACINEIATFTGFSIRELLSEEFQVEQISEKLVRAQYEHAIRLFRGMNQAYEKFYRKK